MSVAQALILGAVQGLTEFVPISSSGHLVLVPEALGWDPPGLTFDVMLHAASLVALVVYFRHELAALVTGFFSGDRAMRRLTILLVIGTIPAVVAGVLLEDYFEGSFGDAPAAALQLLITAVILVAGERALTYQRRRRTELRSISDLHTGDAAVIGVAQAISILPGISRSGATIGAGLALATRRDDAARFAFLLAIPALLGANLVELPELGTLHAGTGALVAGFGASLISSYAAIAALIRYLRTNTLYPFAAYCAVAGVVFYLVVN